MDPTRLMLRIWVVFMPFLIVTAASHSVTKWRTRQHDVVTLIEGPIMYAVCQVAFHIARPRAGIPARRRNLWFWT